MNNNKILNSPVLLVFLTLGTTFFQGANNIFVLIFFNLALYFFYRFSQVFNSKNDKLIKISFIIFLSYLILQITPLPNLLRHIIYLENYSLYQNLFNNKFFFISLDLENSIKGFLIFSSSFLILIIISNIIQDRRSLRNVLTVIFIFAIFQSIFGIVIYIFDVNEIFFYKKIYYIESVTGTYINRNNFSFYLIISFIISLFYLNFYNKHFVKKSKSSYFSFFLSDLFLIRLGILIITLGIILTKSRAGNFTFLIILILIAAYDLIKYKKITFLNITIFSIIIIDLLFLSQMIGGDHTLERFATTSFEGERQRFEVFQIGLNEFLNFPIFGYGLGGFEVIYSLKYNNTFLFYDHIHNDFIEYLGELGSIGFTILFLIIPSIIVRKIFINSQISELKKITLFSLIAVLIHCNLDFALHIPGNIFYIFLIFGICLSQPKNNRIT